MLRRHGSVIKSHLWPWRRRWRRWPTLLIVHWIWIHLISHHLSRMVWRWGWRRPSVVARASSHHWRPSVRRSVHGASPPVHWVHGAPPIHWVHWTRPPSIHWVHGTSPSISMHWTMVIPSIPATIHPSSRPHWRSSSHHPSSWPSVIHHVVVHWTSPATSSCHLTSRSIVRHTSAHTFATPSSHMRTPPSSSWPKPSTSSATIKSSSASSIHDVQYRCTLSTSIKKIVAFCFINLSAHFHFYKNLLCSPRSSLQACTQQMLLAWSFNDGVLLDVFAELPWVMLSDQPLASLIFFVLRFVFGQ